MADQTFAVHCGFFDAINSDRTYSADEMNRPYKRVISNGVFATPSGTPSTDLQVTASSGMNIICKKGEGLFGDKWFENPSGIAITVPSNTSTVPRIDSVLVQVDTRTSGRVGNIVHRTGTPASSPVPPALNQVEGVIEYRLANIRVNAGVSAITQSMITDRRGSSDCPWVTSLIYQVDTSTLYDQWAAAYAEYFEEEKAIWDAWYAQLTEDLDVSMTLDRHTNTVTTTERTFDVSIGLDYNHNTDILEVYINGLRAVEGTQYIVNDDVSISLINPVSSGQSITFVVMRSVISGDATSILTILQSLEDKIAGIAGGTPTVVDSVSAMTEHDQIYILSTDSKWYYYSTTASDWVIGGTYGGVPTDPTLTQEGMAADAKSVGDALADKADVDDVTALKSRVAAVEEYADIFTADVDESVQNWLEEHPEATTTVQDWSLTLEKFRKGELGYITPQMFGAVADGETDDAQAIKSAIDYAMANNCAVYFPSATYAINPQIITINFTGNDSLVMFGDGKTSCIKRMDESLNNKWDRLFVINNADATANSGLLYVHDLYIDSNRRNQSNATDDYTYEASADFMSYFSNANGFYLDTAIFENLWFYDGVADHLDFTGSGVVKIKNIVINKVFTSGRQGTRNDIDFPGIPMGNVFVSNVVCQRFHTEYNGVPTDPQYFYINNLVCDEFTCGGKYCDYKVANLTVLKNFYLTCSAGSMLFGNCEFDLKSDPNYIIAISGIGNVVFNNCIFRSYDLPEGSDEDCTSVYLRLHLNVKFYMCRFEYAGEYDYTAKTLTPITTLYLSGQDYDVDDQKITIDSCDFSDKYSYIAHLYGCGTVFVKNMILKTQYAVHTETAHGLLDITFENIFLDGEDVLSIGSTPANTCNLHGRIVCKNAVPKFSDAHSSHTATSGDLKVLKYITEPLTKTLLDTMCKLPNNYFKLKPFVEFIYAGENKELYPERWDCITNKTVANSSFNQARRFKSIGSGLGDTASRPVCILSPGFQYYDTDLAKTIVWDGTTWTNLDGTAL